MKHYGGFYYVSIDDEVYECRIKGKSKKNIKRILTGDDVEVIGENNTFVITSILSRTNELARPQVANVSQVYLMSACTDPDPDFILIDKMLVNIFAKNAKVKLIFNKCDIADTQKIEQIEKYYKNSNIDIAFISINQNINIDLVKNGCRDEVTILAGQSGVGKTSLINFLLNRDEPVNEVSKKTKRGRHTTKHTELFKLGENAFIVDTPGFSSLDLSPEIHSSKIKDYYPDYRLLAKECYFSNCMHINEPNCLVKVAIDDKLLSPVRYQNYQYIYEEKKEKEKE